MKKKLKEKNIHLIRTCESCPEQYDALDECGNVVGYLRVRWGCFSVWCPDSGADDEVYSTKLRTGDGNFSDDRERKKQLRRAKKEIALWWNKKRSFF